MSEPRPDKWADLLRPTYHYPDEVTSSDLTRRQRRRARRQWRREDHTSRKQWIAERRQSVRGEAPVEQRGGCAVVLIAVALVVIIAGLIRQAGQEHAAAPEPTTTSAATVPTHPGGPAAEPTGPAEPTPTDERVDDLPAEDLLEDWVRAWFTFTPTTGDHESARMQRAEPLMTGELARFLWQDDPLARYYTDAGIDLTVQDLAIALPEEGTAPVDHGTRLTRLVTFSTAYTAGPDTGQEFTSTYAVALYRAHESDPWRVGDYTSADGH